MTIIKGSESYFKAKERLFSELLKSNTTAVINTDDEYGVRLVKKCLDTGKNVMEIGWSGKDIRIEEIMPLASSQIIKVFVLGERYELELPLVGEFQVLNAILALGLAIKTGVKKETAIDLLRKLKGVPGRMELAGYGEGWVTYIRRFCPY
jgi:UDP-N-acetylmuramoyl-L-alanyl-D-glutamate--2,6-diaminopimelate ligase